MKAREATKLKLILHMYNFTTRLRMPSGRRQTSWLFTSLAEELNTERPRNSLSRWSGQEIETQSSKLQVYGKLLFFFPSYDSDYKLHYSLAEVTAVRGRAGPMSAWFKQILTGTH